MDKATNDNAREVAPLPAKSLTRLLPFGSSLYLKYRRWPAARCNPHRVVARTAEKLLSSPFRVLVKRRGHLRAG